MKKSDINEVFEILNDQESEPETELNFEHHFHLLVAVVLSAQATDVSVNKATKSLFQFVKTPSDMLNLGEEKLKTYIKTIGLFNSKAKNVIKLSKDLEEKYDSEIPKTMDELIQLPGVGRKTANVWLNCAMGIPTIAVDTHVARFAQRLGISKHTNPDKIEQELLKKIPKKWHKYAHHHMILHGRYVCKAKNPICQECKIIHLCKFKRKNEDN